jgi:hypothetical protein
MVDADIRLETLSRLSQEKAGRLDVDVNRVFFE